MLESLVAENHAKDKIEEYQRQAERRRLINSLPQQEPWYSVMWEQLTNSLHKAATKRDHETETSAQKRIKQGG